MRGGSDLLGTPFFAQSFDLRTTVVGRLEIVELNIQRRLGAKNE